MFLSRLVRRKKTTTPSEQASEQISSKSETVAKSEGKDSFKRDSLEIPEKKTTACEYCDNDGEESSETIKTTVEDQTQEGREVVNETSEDKSTIHEAEDSKETESEGAKSATRVSPSQYETENIPKVTAGIEKELSAAGAHSETTTGEPAKSAVKAPRETVEEEQTTEETSEFETSTVQPTEAGEGETSVAMSFSEEQEPSTKEGEVSEESSEFEGETSTAQATDASEGQTSVAMSSAGEEQTKVGEVSKETNEFEGETSTVQPSDAGEGETSAAVSFSLEQTTKEGGGVSDKTSEFEDGTSTVQPTESGGEKSVAMSSTGEGEPSTEEGEVSKKSEGKTSTVQPTEADEGEKSVPMSSTGEGEPSTEEGEVSKKSEGETSTVQPTEAVEGEKSVPMSSSREEEHATKEGPVSKGTNEFEGQTSTVQSTEKDETAENEITTGVFTKSEKEPSTVEAEEAETEDENSTQKTEEAENTESEKSETSAKEVETTQNEETAISEEKESRSTEVTLKSVSMSSSEDEDEESDISKETSESERDATTTSEAAKAKGTTGVDENETTELVSKTQEPKKDKTKHTIGEEGKTTELSKETTSVEEATVRGVGEHDKTILSSETKKTSTIGEHKPTEGGSEAESTITKIDEEIGEATKKTISESEKHTKENSGKSDKNTESTITKIDDEIGQATKKTISESKKHTKEDSGKSDKTTESTKFEDKGSTAEEVETTKPPTNEQEGKTSTAKGEAQTEDEDEEISKTSDHEAITMNTEELKKLDAITELHNESISEMSTLEEERHASDTSKVPDEIETKESSEKTEASSSSEVISKKTTDTHKTSTVPASGKATISLKAGESETTTESEEPEGNAIDLYGTTIKGEYIKETRGNTIDLYTTSTGSKKEISTTEAEEEEEEGNAIDLYQTTPKGEYIEKSTKLEHTSESFTKISPAKAEPTEEITDKGLTHIETASTKSSESIETEGQIQIETKNTLSMTTTEIARKGLDFETTLCKYCDTTLNETITSGITKKPHTIEKSTKLEHTSESFAKISSAEAEPTEEITDKGLTHIETASSKSSESIETEGQTPMETELTSSMTTMEIARKGLDFETTLCKYCGTTLNETVTSGITKKPQSKTSETKSTTEKHTSVGKFQKPMVIVVNNSKHFDKGMLESYMNVTLPDVEIVYVDLSPEKEEPKKPRHYKGQRITETEKCTSDFNKGIFCFCDVGSYLKQLLKRVNNGKRIKAQQDYCKKYLKLDMGLIIKPLSVKDVGRRKRGMIYMENQKVKEKNLVFDGIENLFAEEFNLTLTGESMFCLLGETIQIPCKIHINEDTEVIWKFHSLGSEEAVHLPEKVPKLFIHGAAIKHAGNYTCSAAPNGQNTTVIDHWRELEVITFPVYNIRMGIYYKINSSCSLQTGDVVHTYLPKIISPLVCPKDYNEICNMEMERPKCISREDDNYFNVTMNIKMDLDFLLQLEAMCNINCKLRIYENLVHIVYSTLETIQHTPVYYQLEDSDTIVFVPHVSGKEDSAVRIVPPKIIVTCPAGFGLESKKRSVCVICPPQTFSGESNAFCKSCPLGYYQPDPGSKVCLQCSSPVDDKLCLRMLYSDTKLFKIYVGVAFGFIVLMVILILAWTSGLQNTDNGQTYEGSLRHRAGAKTPRDLELGVMQPLLSKRNTPPTVPEIDF